MSIALVIFLSGEIFAQKHLRRNKFNMEPLTNFLEGNFHENIYSNPLRNRLFRFYDGACRMKCWMSLKSRIKTAERSLVPICILLLLIETVE